MDKWRLWYHLESDALFWSQEWPSDGLCEDVTRDKRFWASARERGVTWPPDAPLSPPALGHWPEVSSKGIAGAIVESYKKWERKPADLYPTPVDATESIIPLLQALGIKRVWEPACGDGRLSRVLEWHDMEVISTDLREKPGYGVGGLDFINESPLRKWGWDIGEIDAVITNPPFSLAAEFIQKALEAAPIVIMLVKQSYWNTKGRIPLFDKTKPLMFLPITWRLAFLKEERGNSPLMDCAWCVWKRGNTEDCSFLPVHKSVYPGYHNKGVRASTEILEGEIDALIEALQCVF